MRSRVLLYVDNKSRDLLGLFYLAKHFELNGISVILIPWNIPPELLKRIVESTSPQAALLPKASKASEYIFDFFIWISI